jgi:hypothetical protein
MRIWKPAVAAAACALVIAPLAHASSAGRVTVERGLTVGFSGADGQLAFGDAAWTKRADAVGAQIVRLDVGWDSIAATTRPAGFDASDPNSPGYNWTGLDAEVRSVTAEGFKVLITVTGAPSWAEGPDKPAAATAGSWEPNATDFGQFATAIATRYDGHTSGLPRVSLWQAWNEPNLAIYISPQWVKTGGHYAVESPALYRELLNAFYASVKSVSSSNYVLAAGTAPYGDVVGSEGLPNERLPPVSFDQDLFCLNARDQRSGSCPDPAHFDAIDHHPYGVGGPTSHALNATDVAVPDIDKLTKVLHAAERAKTVAPAGSKGVWVGEVSWNTDPPNPHGVPINEDARWAEQALYVLWSQGVSTVLWYQLADSPESPSGWTSTYTSGLYYDNGAAKPAATAFAFPFLTNRKNKTTVVAWSRSPKAGTLSIESKAGGSWRVLARFHVNAREVFEIPLSIAGKATLRAQVAGVTSLSWSVA